MATERPNMSVQIPSSYVRRRAREQTKLLHGWGLALLVGLATAVPPIVVVAIMEGPLELRVAIISALVTWACLGLVLFGEWLYRLARARGDILAERLVAANAHIDSLETQGKGLRADVSSLQENRPRIGHFQIDHIPEGDATQNVVLVVRNDGESATFIAKFRVSGPSVEEWALREQFQAAWGLHGGSLDGINETRITKGDTEQIRLAVLTQGRDGLHSVRLVAARGIRIIQPWAADWSEGSGKEEPYCDIDLSMFTDPAMTQPWSIRLRADRSGLHASVPGRR